MRIAELGKMYRYERSGVTTGLSRVRAMTLNDAHIFCRPDQVKEEFSNVMRLVESAYATLGITDYGYRLSLRDAADREKYADDDAMWEMAEQFIREGMDALNLPYTEAPGEAAFYGPKLDIQFRDVLGHEETISTIQIDFHLPRQFDLKYVGEDGLEHRPVIIHRAIISTMERMMAYLIELYEGAFPVWLAPTQTILIPITDRHVEYARQVATRLFETGFRTEVDDSSKRMNAKIREAQLQKIPYMLVVGDREQQNETAAVRLRSGENLGAMPIAEFEALLHRMVSNRSLELVD
jgi:threonyl-tRNA synthetase